MGAGLHELPDDVEALKAALIAERDRRIVAEADAASAKAKASDDRALIAHLKLEIEKLKREIYGPRSERTARLLDQLELQLEELESSATEDEVAAEKAAAETTNVAAFSRKRPSRKPLPEHLPRERVIVPGPTSCACCGGTRLAKLGEDITETLEVIPRQWKVIQHVREPCDRTTHHLKHSPDTLSRVYAAAYSTRSSMRDRSANMMSASSPRPADFCAAVPRGCWDSS